MHLLAVNWSACLLNRVSREEVRFGDDGYSVIDAAEFASFLAACNARTSCVTSPMTMTRFPWMCALAAMSTEKQRYT